MAQVNATLKNGGSQLDNAYYDAAEHPHVNGAALNNVIIPAIVNALGTLGVPAN